MEKLEVESERRQLHGDEIEVCNLKKLPNLDCHPFGEVFPHDLLTY